MKNNDECIVCEKKIPDDAGRFNYPVGTHCIECGEKSKWYKKFNNMKAAEIIKYMGIPPENYGLDGDTLDDLIKGRDKND